MGNCIWQKMSTLGMGLCDVTQHSTGVSYHTNVLQHTWENHKPLSTTNGIFRLQDSFCISYHSHKHVNAPHFVTCSSYSFSLNLECSIIILGLLLPLQQPPVQPPCRGAAVLVQLARWIPIHLPEGLQDSDDILWYNQGDILQTEALPPWAIIKRDRHPLPRQWGLFQQQLVPGSPTLILESRGVCSFTWLLSTLIWPVKVVDYANILYPLVSCTWNGQWL